MDNVAERVRHAIEAQCLPHVPQIPAIEDIGAFDLQRDNWEVPAFDETYPQWAVFYWAALGDLARARDMCLRMLAPHAPDLRLHPRSEVFRIKRDLMPLLFSGDRAGIAACCGSGRKTMCGRTSWRTSGRPRHFLWSATCRRPCDPAPERVPFRPPPALLIRRTQPSLE